MPEITRFDLNFMGRARIWRQWRHIIGLSAVLLAPACGTIDGFGGRTTRINVAASDTKTRTILMNVMRAAYRDPLQFSDVSTVSGQGQVTASLGASLPLSMTPGTATTTYSLSPSVGATGSSTFNVTNLNTQEFYNGLQTPISLQQIANLVDAGYDPTLVLFLAVSELDIATKSLNPRTGKLESRYVVIRNNTNNDDDFGTTFNALRNMVEMGFSEQAGEGEPYGPMLTGRETQNSRLVAAIQSAAATDLSLRKLGTDRFQFYRKGAFKPCFDLTRAPLLPEQVRSRQELGLARFEAYRSFSQEQRFREASLVLASYHDEKSGRENVPVPGMTVQIHLQDLCGYKPDPKAATADDRGADQEQSFTLRTRSVEGMFQFLGAIARRQNGIGVGTPAGELLIGTSYVFRVRGGRAAAPAAAVALHDRAFYVDNDPHGDADKTTQVLQILTDLLALESSAKNIPAPGVITVLGR